MTERSDDPRHFAVRRVNPYEGVLQVATTTRARAYSHDGSVWQIQVLGERPDHTWRSASDTPTVEQYFSFGLWDAEQGLHRIPANPVLDIGAMSTAAETLCAQLPGLDTQLPFALSDDHECWAIDMQGRPVALLATTEDASLLTRLHVEPWRATRDTDTTFVAPSLRRATVGDDTLSAGRAHADRLEHLVRQRAAGRAWFRRDAHGRGIPVTGGETLQADAFPPLGLTTDWDEAHERALVEDYLAWRAPRLLMLQHIDDPTRRWLEPHACRRAGELAAAFRLIPRIIDRAAIDAARVEARIRHAAD